MGGNALKSESVRLSDDRFHRVSLTVMSKIYSAFPKLRCQRVEAYFNKPSFGDMDILFQACDEYDPFKIASLLNAVEVVRNGDVTSIGYEVPEGIFQIDLIKCKYIECAAEYFAYNDLGNLMGKVAHKMGFKYGHEGLNYVVRDSENSNHVLDEIPVSKDPDEIFNFLGFDREGYEEGFSEIEDVFIYVTEGEYFNPEIYLLDNINHHSRVRDRKRKTYMGFLQYCRDNKFDRKFFDWSEKEELRRGFLAIARAKFPEFRKAHDEVLEKEDIRKKIKSKYNGKIVSSITGLEGPNIGYFMGFIKKVDPSYESFIYFAGQHEVNEYITSMYKRWTT